MALTYDIRLNLIVLKRFAFILLVIFIFSCSKHEKIEKHVNSKINLFSLFSFRLSNDDTTSHFLATTFMFSKDSLITLYIKRNLNEAFKTKLDSMQIDSINYYLSSINFNRLIDSKSIDSSFSNGDLYCGPIYGFVDSLDKLEVYIPNYDAAFAQNITTKFVNYLFSINGQPTTDTNDIIRKTMAIKSKYQSVAPTPPKIENIKFTPPQIEEKPNK